MRLAAWAVPVQFAALSLVWGASFLLMKVALDGLSPVQLVVGRLALGSLVLVSVMLATRRRWPRELRVWGHLTVVAALLCVVPFTLFAWAGQYIESSLSSIYNATTPIATLLVSVALLPDERPTRTRVIGVTVAAIGVVLVAAPWTISGDTVAATPLLAQLACVGATTSYGLAFAYSRRFVRRHDYDATTIAAVQITIAAGLAILIIPSFGFAAVDLTPSVTISVVLLGGVGTGIAYIWNTRMIQAWGATGASMVTYVTPAVGVALGVLLLHETLQWNEPVGAALVILGVLVSQGRLSRILQRRARS